MATPRLLEASCEKIICPPHSFLHFCSVFTVECVSCSSMMPLLFFFLLKIDCLFVPVPCHWHWNYIYWLVWVWLLYLTLYSNRNNRVKGWKEKKQRYRLLFIWCDGNPVTWVWESFAGFVSASTDNRKIQALQAWPKDS